MEYVGLLDTLLTQPCTSVDGRFYYTNGVHPPLDQPRMPFAIAAAEAEHGPGGTLRPVLGLQYR